MRKLYLVLIVTMFALSLGCNQRPEGKVVVQEYKMISTNHSEMKSIDVYQGVVGLNWLNDHQLIELHEDGLYLRDVNNKQTTLLHHEKDIFPTSVLSLDKRYLFLCKFYEEIGCGTYHIFDIQTKRMVQVQLRAVDLMDSKWVDKENLLSTDLKGNIYQIHISGKVTKVNRKLPYYEDIESWSQLEQVGEQFFYVSNNKLWVWNEQTKQTKQLMDYVNQFVFSPDKKQLVVERVVPNDPSDAKQMEVLIGDSTLILMDITGKVRTAIAKGHYVSGVAWSKDASKLAYIVENNEQPPKLYVSNINNVDSRTLLAVNLTGTSTEWNATRTRLFVNGNTHLQVPKGDTDLHVITLK